MTTFKPLQFSEIKLFPNSAHHLQFIPLVASDTSIEAEIYRRLNMEATFDQIGFEMANELRELAERPDSIRRNLARPSLPWVRAWLGTQEQLLKAENDYEADLNAKLVGIWLAIESNLGTRTRGYSTRESSPPVQTEIAEYNEQKSLETPYAYKQVADSLGQVSDFEIVVPSTSGKEQTLGKFRVSWLKPDGQEPISVDLIVDFGNTRTAVLGLERIKNSPAFAPICKPIPFQSSDTSFTSQEGFNFDESTVLTDSWFLLRQPLFESAGFAGHEIPDWTFTNDLVKEGWLRKREKVVRRMEKVNYRIPHMFVDMSPAIMGRAARHALLRLDLSHGAKYFLSSPKRYAWDTDPAEGEGSQNWHMVLNGSQLQGNVNEIPTLNCQMLRFMPADGSDWKFNEPPSTWPAQQRPTASPRNPRFPRSDALTWTALAIIENAYRTINSAEWRKGNRPYGERRLRNIIVTYPSGWTANELEAYRSKWQKAINIFMHTRLDSPQAGDITLSMSLDEAVASQLPVVVSEIRRLGDDGHRWIEAVGRGKRDQARARVMTIDIGGGTTDVSIVEYSDELIGQGVALSAKVLFKDSTTVAGDELRKMILEHVLLPRVLGNKGNLNREKFEKFLAGAQTTITGFAKWARYTRMLLLPIVNRWLSDLTSGSTEDFTIVDLFQTDEDGQILQEFNAEANRHVGVDLIDLMDSLSLRNQKQNVQDCITSCFEDTFRSLAKHVAAFACDLVIVTGKPSELPPLRTLLEENLPISPNRLIFARGYKAGLNNWPLSPDGRVQDAKFVTVVGAALAQAIGTDLIRGWSLKIVQDARMLTQNWWGVPAGNRLRPAVLEPDQTENVARVMVGTTIARKLLPGDSSAEPVYVLRWRDKQRRNGPNTTVDVEFRRVPPKLRSTGEPLTGESLMITRARGQLDVTTPDGQHKTIPITEKDLELKLCTMHQSDDFWLDTGRFDIFWPEEAQ